MINFLCMLNNLPQAEQVVKKKISGEDFQNGSSCGTNIIKTQDFRKQ